MTTAAIQPRLTPKQICGLIQYKTGLTVPEFADTVPIHKTNMYLAIRNKQTRTPVQGIIAEAVGKTKAELWPKVAKEGK